MIYNPLDVPLVDEQGLVISVTKEELITQIIDLRPIGRNRLHPPTLEANGHNRTIIELFKQELQNCNQTFNQAIDQITASAAD